MAGGALGMVETKGLVGAIEAAVDAGSAAAARVGELHVARVIPRPHSETDAVIAEAVTPTTAASGPGR